MTDSDVAGQSPAPGRRSFGLGLFIVLQVVFLVVHNLAKPLLAQRTNYATATRTAAEQIAPGWIAGTGNVWTFVDGANGLCHRYAEATFQFQDWSLFAPDIGVDCVFPALLFSEQAPGATIVEPGPTVDSYGTRERVIVSDNEPSDMKRYGRWGNFRLRRYENNLVLYLTRDDKEETPEKGAERWRDRIKNYVSENAELLLGYLRFRLEQRGEPPPRQVILLMRRYRLLGPDAGADFVSGPYVVPVARWQPRTPQTTAFKSLEYFNPVTHHFEPLAP